MGKRNGRQRYQCKKCHKKFTFKNLNWVKSAYLDYTKRKQTYRELEKKYKKDHKTIRKYFEQHSPVTGEVRAPKHPVVVILDAFFWTRRLVARAEGQNLMWKEIESEKVEHYEALLNDLKTLGIQSKAFVIDGRRGVRQLLLRMLALMIILILSKATM